MFDAYLTFRSVTYAQRGEQALRRAGMDCALSRTPRCLEEKGCGYCLRVRADALAKAAAVLRAQELPFRKAYVPRENGALEEAPL